MTYSEGQSGHLATHAAIDVSIAQHATDIASVATDLATLETGLPATFAPKAIPTLCVLGDSITEQGGILPGNLNRNRTSPWPWGLNLSGQRLDILGNDGVGGDKTYQVLARVTNVVAKNPGYCHVLAGTNDVWNDIATATTTANLDAIVEALLAAGIRVFIGTIPPKDGGTTTQRALQAAANDHIRQMPYLYSNVTLVDYEAVLTDPTTGIYPTGWSADGTHLVNNGGFAAGREFARVIAATVPENNRLATSKFGTVNLLGNAGRFFLGNGSPGGGWQQAQYSVAPTNTRVARADNILGTMQQAVIPDGDKCTYTVNVPISADMAVGDTVEMVLEYDLSNVDPTISGTGKAFTSGIQAYVNSAFIGPNMRYDLWMTSTTEVPPITSRSGVFRTPPLLIPAGTTLIQ